MTRGVSHPEPIPAGEPMMVYDPNAGTSDMTRAGLSDAALRDQDLIEARKVLASLKGSAIDIPELGKRVNPLSDLIEQADDYHMEAEEARLVAASRARDRDNAEASALRAGKDPVTAAEAAQKSLDDAGKAVQDAERLANTAVQVALQSARRERGVIKREVRARAPENVRKYLRRFEEERQAAIEAVDAAKRAIHRVASTYEGVKGLASQLPDSDQEMRRLIGRSKFDMYARRVGTNQPTLDGIVQHLESVPERIGYGSYHPHRAYPVVGSDFGKAVRIACGEVEDGQEFETTEDGQDE